MQGEQSRMNHYLSDTHFGHENIIRFCWRPFINVEQMNAEILIGIMSTFERGNPFIFGGDLAFGRWVGCLSTLPEELRQQNIMVLGNHDKESHVPLYSRWFANVVGKVRKWRENCVKVRDGDRTVLVSHYPQQERQGCDYNFYGHFHNNLFLPGRDDHPENREAHWVLSSPHHFNISAEILDYKPRTLDEVITLNRAYPVLHASTT
jgi:calcineurin-like phosphoesterase family protein